MNDQLTTNVEVIVDEIFKKKEEAEMKKETEAALNAAAATITELNASLEAKDTEHKAEVESLQESIASLETQLNEVAEAKKALEDEKADFDEEKEKLTKRAEAAEEELDNMKKDQMAADRMEALKTAGVASTDSEAQRIKVREMTDEDFASYKDELVSVRSYVIKELEDAGNSVDDPEEAKKEEAKKKEEAEKKKELLATRLAELKEAGAEITDEEEIAKIQDMTDEDFESYKDEAVASLSYSDDDSIDPMKAIAAALNMEAEPAKDILNKYRELGAQMAENIKSKQKR
jgi:hypothetical protein